MEDKIDRFGLCPNCHISWNMGDILENLKKMSSFSHKTEHELIKIAANYGWTSNNKANFSKLISHELEDGRHLLECPNISCQHVFDRYTGGHYKSMWDARRNSGVEELRFINQDTLEDTHKKEFVRLVHVTPQNREEIERDLQNKAKPQIEMPRINPDDIECPFDV